jgi:hypothetical protein
MQQAGARDKFVSEHAQPPTPLADQFRQTTQEMKVTEDGCVASGPLAHVVFSFNDSGVCYPASEKKDEQSQILIGHKTI